jgi:leader peptidase (prepilin peptidase)/N-methyltransferase
MLGPAIYCSVIILVLLALGYIDLKTLRLPNTLTLPLIALGLAVNLSSYGFCSFRSSLAGAVFGIVIIYGFNFLYKAFFKKNGVGMGDAKLLGGLGAVFGLSAVIPLLFCAAVACLLMMLFQVKNKDFASIIAFGPYLCGVGICMAIYQYWSLNS